MAINPSVSFAGRVAAPTTGYPYGSSQNETTPGAGDGTQYNAARANDVFGMQQALLASVGIVPTNTADAVRASQYLQAIIALASGMAELYVDSGAADAYVVAPASADRQGCAAYFDGMQIAFVPDNANTGACTVAVGGLAAKSIVDGNGNDPAAGVISTTLKQMRYDAVLGKFVLIGIGVSAGQSAQVNQAVTATVRATTTTLGTSLNHTLSNTSANITAFNGVAGVTYHCKALGAGGITHSAGLSILQGGASVVTAAGDTFDVYMLTATTCEVRNYAAASNRAFVDVKTAPGRAFGTTYTNNTGREITVYPTISNPNPVGILVIVDGVAVIAASVMSTMNMSIPFTVPAGSTYLITDAGGSTIEKWFELR